MVFNNDLTNVRSRKRKAVEGQLPFNTQHNTPEKLTPFSGFFRFSLMLILVSLLLKKEEISHNCVTWLFEEVVLRLGNCCVESTNNFVYHVRATDLWFQCALIHETGLYLHRILRKPVYGRINLASRNAFQVEEESKNRDQNCVHVYGEILINP